MVTSVASAPYFSYLNQVQGGTGVVAPVSTAATTSTSAPTTTSTTSSTASAASTNAQQEVSSLLNGSNGFSPEVLTLLQGSSSGSFNPISTLLGGGSTYDPTTSLYANLFASQLSAQLGQAQTDGTAQAATSNATPANTSPVQSLVNATTQASQAYNQTLVQNAQNVTKANSYQADGVTPLVA